MKTVFALVACAAATHSPPRGWNSYDSFTKNINETEFLENCAAVAKYLLPHGYDTCTIDYLWYEPASGPWFLDDYCRPIPEPARFPSSVGGAGLKPIADKVHAMGLKFGIHIMRGTSTYAVTKNCKVKGTNISVADIVVSGDDSACPWKTDSLGVDMNKPGAQEFYDSLYEQYAMDWDVDFIKNDCVFGSQLTNFTLAEIKAQSSSIKRFWDTRPIAYSLSPGGGTNTTLKAEQGRQVAQYVNSYRVTEDTWDHWSMLDDHFKEAAAMAEAGLIGRDGLAGKSFPDLDMLPLGLVTQAGDQHAKPDHYTNLTADEQRTIMTLWAVARSPLIFGGDARDLGSESGQLTLSLLTNEGMLGINADSTRNRQVHADDAQIMWAAEQQGGFVAALFNIAEEEQLLTAPLTQFGVPAGQQCSSLDVWSGVSSQVAEIHMRVPAHGAQLLQLINCSSVPLVV